MLYPVLSLHGAFLRDKLLIIPFKGELDSFFRIFESHFRIRYMAKTASYTNIRLFVTSLMSSHISGKVNF